MGEIESDTQLVSSDPHSHVSVHEQVVLIKKAISCFFFFENIIIRTEINIILNRGRNIGFLDEKKNIATDKD